jgi:serine/threonine-protein kinase
VGDGPPSDRADVIGDYHVLKSLATGGMGEILLASKRGPAGFEKLVVIKRLLPHLAADARFVEMLLREAKLVARLSHPNICAVHDLGRVEGQFYIAMEYLEGLPLSLILTQAAAIGRRLDPCLVVGLFSQACEGLHHAHQATDDRGQPLELVHRDVSPSNLMVTTSGVVKVLDFGIAKAQRVGGATRTDAPKGKLPYMSPEQLQAERLDRRSDIFSLGAVLFEALTLERLFRRPTEYLTYRAIRKDPIPPVSSLRPDVPAPLAAAIERALARDRSQRFATAHDLEHALREGVASLGPPWTAKQISRYLQEHHKEDIPTPPPARAAMPMARAPAVGGPKTVTLLPTGAAAEKPAPSAPRRTARRLLAAAGVLVLVGVAVFVGAQLASSPQAVLVYEGQVTRDDAAAPPAPPAPAAPPASAPAAAAAPAPPPPRPQARKPARPPAAARRLTRIFEKRDREVAACFSRYGGTGSQAPADLAIVFRTDAQGRVERAQLEPTSLAETPLGRCILTAARRTEFGPQSGTLEFSIPLRVHATP